ncbi:hypothetical protein GGI00_004404 [Coemansia sp. RSA 2681]|nr:hypothetical protein GGI00_004404 [Coemansia sp. RSA 2681]
MNLFRGGSAYNSLVSAAERGAAGKAQGPLISLLQNWRAPLEEFSADELTRALGRVDPAQSTLAFAQIAVDCAALARTSEQFGLAAQALRRVAAEGRLEALLQAFPAMLQRLADAAARAGDAALACELLADMAEALIAHMAADQKIKDDGLGRRGGVRLTAVHVECVRQCVLARRAALHRRVAARVLGVRLDALGACFGAAVRGRALVEYSLYGGMVYAALGADDDALRAWQRVFAVPARHVSAIAVAAFKRRALLHVAARGSRARLPAFYAAVHARALEAQAAAYVALADACCPAGVASLAPALARIGDMRGALAADENAGLADRLVHALPAHFVRRCGDVYASLRVDRLADLIGFSAHPLAAAGASTPGGVAGALARYIRAMDDPTVVLDAGDAVVRFVPARATVSALPNAALAVVVAGAERQWAEAVAAKVAEATALRLRLEELDRHLALTKEYAIGSRDSNNSSKAI